MRRKAPTRFGVRTLPVLIAAAGCLVALAACTPSAIRVPAGKVETLPKIAVIPMESPRGIPPISLFFHGPGGRIYLAGEHDNGVLPPDSRPVLLDGLAVFVRPPRADVAGSGPAERFEKALTGPRTLWFPSADLVETAARRLREGGKEATAFREIVRIPGVASRSPEGVPRDGWTHLSDWYGKDPDPLDLKAYRDRGVQAVLVIVCEGITVYNNLIMVRLWAKLIDPADGRTFGRTAANGGGGAARSPDAFPGRFHSASDQAVEKALKEMGLVR